MSLVHQHQHIMLVGDLHYRPQVRADAVIGGIVHEHRRSVRVGKDSLLHLRKLHAEGDAYMLVHVRVNIHRLCTAEDEGVDDAAVDVPRQDYLIPCLAGSEYHALHRGGGPSHHKIGVSRPEGISCQLFRVHDDGNGVTEIIKGLHRIYVKAYALLAQELYQLRVAASPLVAGNVKGDDSLSSESFQRLINGRRSLLFNIHSDLSGIKKQVTILTCVINVYVCCKSRTDIQSIRRLLIDRFTSDNFYL